MKKVTSNATPKFAHGVISKVVFGLVGVFIGGVIITYNMADKPPLFKTVDEMIKSIVTGKPFIGNLEPARDLRGTWKSSIPGKGLEAFGQIVNNPTTSTIYINEDIILIIDTVKDNIATGRTKTRACLHGFSTAPAIGVIQIPETCKEDADYAPITIRVSSSALDFGTITNAGGTMTMTGSFTTDIMIGSATINSQYGVIKGKLNLSRVQ